ncbi:MAG: bifunctional (p)ppGpp synthetase/guanosine-3',5'-bis(diphosphate) 3'-pyrophosphohydrolase [Rickettsia endosymbiont of Ixodes persulcatus]|nr:bifunctional (p)ppGpp synthetase/guanosine-3',5'-bis(diphosphate) 3'-pyrophosphohydrolase [Rickettsia endosymbiont of Ixodes persulcatus]MCZ6903827.1 bifunctional (p)ppGpp synthetase/guanosine-3',5'-bis(diphosphate) 3'-pyrophosphohydrolase [Rickettsia endosymbiont of Ixodes persulcatus]MCZ6908481.1 bifunctional (p)ppGpp synthetase/guanosine-3',5'-bis(diphosphate) 3'-pyrophosphohydrolase [Rickettsia endosymbiont of Ixodes persulcatus]MCZ6909963.1 bifunctional (p)ppGpp synthetase/guanosine-3',5
MIYNIINLLKEDLNKAEIENEIYMRLKEPYSVLKKMKRKEVPLDALKDLIACRIIVKSKGLCYNALDVVKHSPHLAWLYTKDYINRPKSNGYQSLHNIMQLLYSKRNFEIQIRSKEMHKDAELGRAAHLNYKEEQEHHLKKVFDVTNDTILSKARQMVKQFEGLEEQIVEYEKEIMRIWYAKYDEMLKWENTTEMLIFNEE